MIVEVAPNDRKPSQVGDSRKPGQVDDYPPVEGRYSRWQRNETTDENTSAGKYLYVAYVYNGLERNASELAKRPCESKLKTYLTEHFL